MTAIKKPRILASITPEDAAKVGRPMLFGWGLRHVERLSGRCSRTIRNAIRRGIPLHVPTEMVAWSVAQRDRELADRLLVALGYAPRYAVKSDDISGMRTEPPGYPQP